MRAKNRTWSKKKKALKTIHPFSPTLTRCTRSLPQSPITCWHVRLLHILRPLTSTRTTTATSSERLCNVPPQKTLKTAPTSPLAPILQPTFVARVLRFPAPISTAHLAICSTPQVTVCQHQGVSFIAFSCNCGDSEALLIDARLNAKRFRSRSLLRSLSFAPSLIRLL